MSRTSRVCLFICSLDSSQALRLNSLNPGGTQGIINALLQLLPWLSSTKIKLHRLYFVHSRQAALSFLFQIWPRVVKIESKVNMLTEAFKGWKAESKRNKQMNPTGRNVCITLLCCKLAMGKSQTNQKQSKPRAHKGPQGLGLQHFCELMKKHTGASSCSCTESERGLLGKHLCKIITDWLSLEET